MKTETLIAETPSGKQVECWVKINEKGNIKTQYPLNYAGSIDHKATYAIELTKQQFENLFEQNCPIEIVRVRVKNTQDWYDIEFKAEQIKEIYEESLSIKSWEKCLQENSLLTLSRHEGFNKVFGLPEALNNKNALLLSQIKLNEEKKITTKELIAWIKKLEQKKIEKANKNKKALIKKAKETGKPQILNKTHSEYNSHRGHWSEDYIVEYINADGSTFTREEKAEPDHY